MSEFDAPYFDNSGYPYFKPPEKLSSKIRKFYTGNGASELTGAAFSVGIAFLLYMALSRVYALILTNVEIVNKFYFSSDSARIFLEMLYSMCCVGMPFIIVYFAARKLKILKAKIPLGKMRKNSHTFFLVLGGIAVCFAGNMVTNIIITFFANFGIEFSSFNRAVSETSSLPQNVFQFLLMVTHTAVFPALFEEFAFRGVIMQSLKKYGDWFAIVVSAVFFGLIHGNMTQVPFALIAGIALGYIVTVTGSLWSGVILHFCNNFISLLVSLVRAYFSEAAAMAFSTVTVYGLMLTGALAFAYFISVNPCFYRLYPSREKRLGTQKSIALLILNPPVLISVVAMIFPIFQDMIFMR